MKNLARILSFTVSKKIRLTSTDNLMTENIWWGITVGVYAPCKVAGNIKFKVDNTIENEQQQQSGSKKTTRG